VHTLQNYTPCGVVSAVVVVAAAAAAAVAILQGGCWQCLMLR